MLRQLFTSFIHCYFWGLPEIPVVPQGFAVIDRLILSLTKQMVSKTFKQAVGSFRITIKLILDGVLDPRTETHLTCRLNMFATPQSKQPLFEKAKKKKACSKGKGLA